LRRQCCEGAQPCRLQHAGLCWFAAWGRVCGCGGGGSCRGEADGCCGRLGGRHWRVVVPGSVFQLAAVLLLVVPGIVYAAVRRRLTGPLPDDKDFSVRLVRAVAISAVLDLVYALVAGPRILKIASRPPEVPGGPSGPLVHPRSAAALALVLLVVVPTVLGALAQIRLRRSRCPLGLAPVHHPVPTAWDRAAPNRGNCFVRVFTSDGHWVGGWVGPEAYVSTYPEPRDIFISVEWALGRVSLAERGLWAMVGACHVIRS